MHFHHNKRIDKHINDKKRVAAMDWLALAFALLGGFFHGTYPAFIKAPAVREANVHPIVFQWYKSVCTSVFGLLILAIRVAFRCLQRIINVFEAVSLTLRAARGGGPRCDEF